MGNDCPDPSLPERIRLLEQARSLDLQRIEVFRRKAERAEERARHAEEQLEKALRAEVLRRAANTEPAPAVNMPQLRPQPRKRTPKHERHLHIVPGFAAAGAAWLWATRARRVVTVGVSAAALTTGAVTPSVITPGSPAHAGQPPSMVRHHHQTPGAPAPQPSRKKRHPSGRNERNTPGPSPSHAPAAGGGTPAPSPLPKVSPMPTVPPPTPPVPSPSPPVCLPPPACHPLHVCCGKGDGGLVLATRAWLISKHRLRLAA